MSTTGSTSSNYWIVDMSTMIGSAYESVKDDFKYSVRVQETANAASKTHINTRLASEFSEAVEMRSSILYIVVDRSVDENANIIIDVDAIYNESILFQRTYSFDYIPEHIAKEHTLSSRADKQTTYHSSYTLLRANPKLTGNIKTVVTSDGNMYLDTFKVSDALSDNKYRHVRISPETYYGSSIHTTFSDLSSGDLYKVDPACYTMFTTANSYADQYYGMYNCGVRTNEDKLYSENFAYLAPLRIREHMPDFFLVFKVSVDKDFYSMTDDDRLDFFLRNGTIVKSFDFRMGSKLGTFIRNIQDRCDDYPGDIYVSYNRSNYNIYNGISIDHGNVSRIHESATEEDSINNQVALNDFYTLGFERNRVVAKDIVNFEFMFDDPSADIFSINNYFGLYVTLNSDSEFSIVSYGESNKFTSEINDFSSSYSDALLPEGTYGNVIYGISTPDSFVRLTSPISTPNTSDSSKIASFVNKPYKNVLNGKLHQFTSSIDVSYITVEFASSTDVGDHYRVIYPTSKLIYEVICTNNEDGGKDDDGKYRVIHNTFMDDSGNNYDIYRCAIKVGYKSADPTPVKDFVTKLADAFNSFDTNIFTCSVLSDNEISISGIYFIGYFERICSRSGFDEQTLGRVEDYSDEDNTITYFGNITPSRAYLDLSNTKWLSNGYSYFYPMHFEVAGSRIAYIGKMQSLAHDVNYYTIESDNLDYLSSTVLLYKSKASKYVPTDTLSTQKITFSNSNIVTEDVSSYALKYYDGTILMNIESPIDTRNTIHMFSTYPLHNGICSILSVKDFVYDIYDTNSKLSNASASIIVGTSGEFSSAAYNGEAVLQTDEESISDYFDKTETILSRNSLYSDVNEGLSKLVDNSTTSSSVSLTAPYTCKWMGIGTDGRGERMRIMYDYDNLSSSSKSYFIPSNFDSTWLAGYSPMNEECGLRCFSSRTESQKLFAKYVGNTIFGLSNSRSLKKDIINGNASIDDLFSSDKNSGTVMSLAYSASQSGLEFISGGIKFRINSNNDNIVDMSGYKNYLAAFVAMPGYNQETGTAIDLIIDETKRELLLVWYTGLSTLDSSSCSSVYGTFYSMLRTSYGITDITSSYYNGQRIIEYPVGVLSSENTSHLSDMLSKSSKFLTVTTDPDVQRYVKHSDIMLSGKSEQSIKRNSIVAVSPIGIANGNETDATNDFIDNYADPNYSTAKAFLISTSSSFASISSPDSELERLIDDCSSVSVFVKTENESKDLSRLDNLITVSVVEATKYARLKPVYLNSSTLTPKYESAYVGVALPTYAEPMVKDMISFESEVPNEVCTMFDKSFDNANVIASGASRIPQLWINKVTSDSNYCISDNGYRMSIDVLHNVSILDTAWSKSKYRKYYINGSEEAFESYNGSLSGIEPNCFIGSRGIALKNSAGTIVLTSWKNTKISAKKRTIKLNITDSLIYYIRFSSGYINSWLQLSSFNDSSKTQYIKSSILKHISIGNNIKFELYKKDSANGISVVGTPSSLGEYANVSNTPHELTYENGKYYMTITVSDDCMYYPKITISL